MMPLSFTRIAPLRRLAPWRYLARLATNRRGVSAMEYAVLAAVIITMFSVGIATLGTSISSYYGYVSSVFVSATSS